MHPYYLIVAFLFSFCSTSFSQYISEIAKPDKSTPAITDTTLARVKYAKTIKPEDIKKHLEILASDEYEGRETGEEGNDRAAQYIADYFEKLGLPKLNKELEYFQPIQFTSAGWEDTEIKVNGKRFKHLWDYLAYPTSWENIPEFKAEEVVYAGYGIDDPRYNDYKNLDVNGKVVMINMGEPVDKDSVSYITGTKEMSEWNMGIMTKLKLAQAKGAKLVLVISQDLKEFLMQNRKYVLGPNLRLGDLSSMEKTLPNHAYISTSLAEKIIGKQFKKVAKARKKLLKKGKNRTFVLPAKIDAKFGNYMDLIEGFNVMGYVEGGDKKEEIVVVSAHFDHLGKRGDDIFNGADDNGSGTSTLLDIAEAYVKAKEDGNGPRRSILFLLVTGEEKGLLGSQYFVENPVFPLENIVANVNVDMIGRVDEAHKEDPNYVYVIGSDRLSTDLHKINKAANDNYTKLTLDYTYNSEEDPNRFYYRSDHYNFAVKGIPAIFYFSGVHDDYHRPTDTPEKIRFNKVATIGELIYHTIWDLANQDKRIAVDVEVLKD